jgi:hypothetical protein
MTKGGKSLSKKYRNEDTKRRITPVLITEEADDKRNLAAKEEYTGNTYP